MMIRFLGPFESLSAKEVRVDLRPPLVVRDLIGLLSSRYAAMARYSEIETDADLSAHLAVFRGGKMLRIADPVYDTDIIEILLPATGG
jgi:hypothetical protein